MQQDRLLLQWKRVKQICRKIVQISKNANIYNKVSKSPMQKQTSQQFIAVYETVYRLCLTKEKQETRVTMVYKQFKDILKNSLIQMCKQLKNEKDVYKLKYLRKIWQAYIDILKRLKNMFAYLNRDFHIKQGRIQQLQKTGMNIIVLTLFNQNTLPQYQSIYFKQIQRIRKTKDFTNSQILKDMIDMLYKIHLKLIQKVNRKAITRYTQFYAKYLRNAKQFYEKNYNILKQLNPAEYFQQIDNIYQIQTKINTDCFGIIGESLTNREFTDELIQKYRQTLMKSPKGLKNILANRQIRTLKIIIQMYMKLTKNIDGFKQQFQQFIFEDIKSFMQQIKNQIVIKRTQITYCAFLQKIINKNKQYMLILQQSFMHLGDFATYYKSGVEKAFKAVNLPVTIEEILTIYIDTKFRMSNVEQQENQDNIKNIINLFMCIENKDLFLMRYTQKLAKKLLNITPECLKNHQTFVEYLKLNCGIKFTQRVQTLIYEHSIVQDYQPIIKKILQQKKVDMDFNIRIFSEGSWPTTNIIELPIHYFPLQMQKAYDCFQIYRQNYNSKKTFKISYLESKLRWLYYFDKQVENKLSECYFETNCLQGALLYQIYKKRPQKVNFKLLQNFHEKVSVKVIKDNLNKMAQSTQNILIKSLIQGQTFYQFNYKMKSMKRLITYQTITSMNQQQKLFQQQDLGRDRQIVLDANIAKLMKARKVIDFQTLFSQISKMIKIFNPTKKDIKIAVERLINKELLQRDQKDTNKVKYVD